MEQLSCFFQNGCYREMLLAAQVKILRDNVRRYQESAGLTRVVWLESGVVGKFTSRAKYDYNWRGLMEFFGDRGLLTEVLGVRWSKLLKEEQVKLIMDDKSEHTYKLSVKPTNKLTLNEAEIVSFLKTVELLDISRQVELWRCKNERYKELQQLWEQVTVVIDLGKVDMKSLSGSAY